MLRISLAVLLLLVAIPASALELIQSRWHPDHYIHIENRTPAATPITMGWWSAQWIIERNTNENYVRFRNRWQESEYLTIDDNDRLGSSPIEEHWNSARWRLEPTGDGYVRIVNV